MTRGAKRVLRLLGDGQWHTTAEIEEECQVTAHSRLAEIRATHAIDKRHNHGATGRRMYSWRLVATAEQLAGIADAEPVSQTSAGSAAGDTEFVAVPYHDDVAADDPAPAATHTFAQGGERTAAAGSGPTAAVLEDDSEAGWRDLFPAESAGEALPPPSEQQLELGVGS